MRVLKKQLSLAQLKLLILGILAISIINFVIIVIVILNLGSIASTVKSINDRSSDSGQIANLQTSVSNMSDNVAQIKNSTKSAPVVPKPTTCTGSLGLSLTGLILNSQNISLTDTVPVDLTCSSL